MQKFEKTLWTLWRPVLRGSKSDDPTYRRPVYVGAAKKTKRAARLQAVKLGKLGLVAAGAGNLIQSAKTALTDGSDDPFHIPAFLDRRKK